MATSIDRSKLFALVMAGGSGTRFWPLSRRARPKQLLALAGGRSLLSATVERLAPLVPPERVVVVTGRELASAVRTELPGVPAGNVLAEPAGRDTAPCIGWLAWRLAAEEADAVMLVVPADHVVGDGEALRRALAAAAGVAAGRGGLVTLGLEPTRPETGFGYLELGEREADCEGLAVHRVGRFVEKPDRAGAEAMLASGRHRWNSGMFAWRVGAIVTAIREHLPALAEGLDAMFAAAAEDGEEAALERFFPALPKVSIDFGVMEKAHEVRAVPVAFGWSDVGSWPALEEVLAAGPAGVALGDTLALDAERCVLVSDGPLVAAIGVSDLVVVATRDAVLVVPKGQAQRVKDLVEELRRRGRDELL